MAARKGEWWSLREDLLLEVYAHNGMTWIQVAERLDRPVKATRRRAYLIDVQRTFASPSAWGSHHANTGGGARSSRVGQAGQGRAPLRTRRRHPCDDGALMNPLELLKLYADQ